VSETSNLRLLPVAQEDERILATIERPPCLHRRSDLDRDARRIYCRDCKSELDAFDVLLRLAREREQWRAEGDAIRAKTIRAERLLEETERQLANAKRRLARASK
jgi:hypothetical protein